MHHSRGGGAMAKSTKLSVGRRSFLKGAEGGAAALVAATGPVKAQQPQAPRNGSAPIPAKEPDPGPVSSVEVLTGDHPGSDFMVDVIKALGFEYVIANPGSSFRGLHESLVNYGGN